MPRVLSARAFSKLAAAVLMVPAAVRADTFNWSSTGDAQWSNPSNWTSATSPTTHIEPTLTDDAVLPLGAAVTTINLLAGEQAKSLSVFDNFRLSGGDLTLGTGGPISSDIGTTTALDSKLTGSNGLNKTGFGTLHLSNTTNDYTGTTTVANGTLIIDSPATLGVSATAIAVTGNGTIGNPSGQLVLAGSGGGMNLSRGVSLGGGGPVITGFAFNSIGNNTLSGGLTTAGGNTTRLASYFGTLTLSSPITLAGVTNSFQGNFTTVISGAVTGGTSAILEKGGNGTLILTGDNTATFTGIIQVGTNNIRVDGAAALGSGTAVNAVNLNGGTLEVRSNTVAGFETRKVRFSTNTGLFVDHAIAEGPITAAQLKQNFTFADFANSANNVTFTASGRNGSNLTFTGSVTALTTGNNITLNNNSNGTVTYVGFSASDSNATARTYTFGGNSETTIATNITMVAGANLPAIAKSGTGVFTINGTGSTYTGATTVNAGTLAIRNFDAINAANTSGSLNLGNATTTGGTLNYLGATGTGAGETVTKPINLNTTTASAFINANQAGSSPTALIINSAISAVAGNKTLVLGGTSAASILNEVRSAIPAAGGTLAVQKIGTNTWNLTAANAYTGATNVSGGILQVTDIGTSTSVNVIPDAGVVAFTADTFTNAAGGTFQYVGAANRASTETAGALTPTAGHGTVSVSPGTGAASATLTVASLGTRGAGATLNFTPAANASIVFTAAAGANGILGGYATFNGVDWAAQVSAGGTLAAFNGYTNDLPASGASATTNYLVDTTAPVTTAAQSVNSLKFAPAAAGQTITLGGALTITSGGVLFDNSNGPATITGSQLGVAAELIVTTNGSTPGNALTVSSLVGTGAASLTKSGTGTLILTAANAYTGATVVNQGTLRLSGATATLGNASAASATTIRQGAILDLNAAGASGKVNIGALLGAGTITNSGGGTNADSTLGIGIATTTTGTGYFTGLLQDGPGGGRLNVTKAGAASFVQYLHGANTYKGVTTLSSGTLGATLLADIGQDSSIGQGDSTSDTTNAASLVFAGGILQYIGANATVYQQTQTPTVSTNRLFTLAGNGTIDSSGQYGNNVLAGGARNDAALVFRNAGAVRFGGTPGPRTLTVTGNSIGDNEIALQLADMDGSNALSVTKASTGLWRLSNPGNAYTGNTTISGGALQVGNLQSANASLPNTSPVVLAGGVLQTAGSFTRNLAGALPTGNANTVFWNAAGGGFAASTGKLTVNLGGANGTLNWESGGFVPNSQALILSSTTALSEVEITNPINLTGTTNTWPRTIQVDDNGTTQTDYATISGVISGGPATGTNAIQKTSTGILQLLGANTYTGDTLVAQGTLVVKSVGGGSISASGVGGPGGVLKIGNGTTAANLWYVGGRETVVREIDLNQTSGNMTIDSSGSGPLILTNVVNPANGTAAKTLVLNGINTEGNEISSVLNDSIAGTSALSVSKTQTGTWILSGANTYSGTTTATAGMLGIGRSTSGDWSATTGTGPFGRGTLTIGNVLIFAAGGADRSIANPITVNTNTTTAFFGSNSLAFTGAANVTAGNNGDTYTNSLIAGKTLTFGAFGTTDATAGNTKTQTFNGTGDTIVSGPITVPAATPAIFNITYSGTGSLTLSATSGSNYNGVTTVSSGILRVTSAAALGNTSRVQVNTGTFEIRIDAGANFNKSMALGGNGIINMDSSIGGTAVGGIHAFADLSHPNTTAQSLTINGNNNLYGISFTSLALNNSTGNNTTLIPNNAFVNINGPVTNPMSGTLTSSNFDTLTLDGNSTGNIITGAISDMPGGSLALGGFTRLMKNNVSTWTLKGTSTYTGVTGVNAGRLNLGSGGNLGNTAVTVTANVNTPTVFGVIPGASGATNTLGGTLVLAGGPTLTMQDGATSTFSVTGATTLNTTGTAPVNMTMEVAGGGSNATDLIAITGAVTDTGPVRLQVLGVGTGALSNGQTLTLISAPAGGLVPANFTLLTPTVSINGQSYPVSLSNSTANAIILAVTTGGSGNTAYWTGDQDGNWSTSNGGNTNWAIDAGSGTDLGAAPNSVQDVFFSSTTPAPGNLSTTLGTNQTVNSVNFTAGSPAVTIAAAGSETLTIMGAKFGNVGLTVAAGAASHTITAPVVIGGSQTWIVDSTNAFTAGNIDLGGNVLTVSGAGNTVLNGTITGAAGNGLVKSGSGKLTLSGTNSFNGPTSIDQGTLAFTGNAVLTGGLQFGSTAGIVNAGSLDLSTASLTAPSLVAQNNSTSPTTVDIGNGQTLKVTGAVTLGFATVTNSTTKVTMSGGGTFTVGAAGSPTNNSLTLGQNITSNVSNAVTLDMGGLGTFFANLGTGTLRVGDPTNSGGVAAAGSSLILAPTSTIFATTFTSESPDSAQPQSIILGATTNSINANTITIGGSSGANRSNGVLQFSGATGDISIHNLAGTGAATFNLVYGTATTAAVPTGLVDFTGHNATLVLSTLNIAGRTATSGGSTTGTFLFDTGSMSATGINIGNRNVTATTGTLTGATSGTLTLTGGTTTIGTSGVVMAVNTSTNGAALNTVDATLNIGGVAQVTIAATGGGQSITLGSNTGTITGTASNITSAATVTITGGTLSVSGDIGEGAGPNLVTSKLTLDGGTLNLNNNDLGLPTAIDTIEFFSGTLSNVKSINGAGGLTKSSAGTLSITGTNTYTGPTTVSAGKLLVNGTITSNVTATTASSTVGGTGTIAGNLTISAGTLSPGNSPGVLHVTGNVALANTATYVAEVGGNTPGNTAASYDQTIATGSLSIAGATLSAVGLPGYTPASSDVLYILVRGDALPNTTFFANAPNEGDTVSLGNGMTAQITYLANYDTVTPANSALIGGNDVALYNVVPEPASVGMMGLAALGLLARRRRKGR